MRALFKVYTSNTETKPKDTLIETVYSSKRDRSLGLNTWLVMFKELWSSRELIWQLMQRDFSARYRQSMLGYIWAILPPLTTVIIFTYLTSHRVLPIGKLDMPYPVFALWNICVWQLFASSILTCTNSLVASGSLVTKINFPKSALIFASLGQPIFEFLIRLLIFIVVAMFYDVPIYWTLLFMPILLFPMLLMALGAGFFLSILNLIIRDIGSAVGVLLTFGMFAAPVLYPPPISYPFVLVNYLNPISPFLIATQDLLADGSLLEIKALSIAVFFSILLFLLGWRIFQLTIIRLIERA